MKITPPSVSCAFIDFCPSLLPGCRAKHILPFNVCHLENKQGARCSPARWPAVRWRASRCCVVRMPFSAPLLPGVWALAWGRARTGDENGWWSAALGGVAVRLPPPRRELARAPAGWRACASLGWTTCPWTATLARSRTLSRCRSGKGRLWALRAGDLTATVGTATVRSFQASLTDISVRTRGSLCVCERERERERERVVVRVCVCTYVFATHPQKDSE